MLDNTSALSNRTLTQNQAKICLEIAVDNSGEGAFERVSDNSLTICFLWQKNQCNLLIFSKVFEGGGL